jgi:glucan endo-1,3-alpha-glucosidase
LIIKSQTWNNRSHEQVGNWQDFTVDLWQRHMTSAQDAGIDGFVLNTAPNTEANTAGLSGNIEKQLDYAFNATELFGSTFKLFFSFDYLGAGKPWDQADVKTALITYANHPAYFRYNDRAYVSTFEGTNNINDWPSIKAAVPGGIYFVPDWTSLGPEGIKSHFNVIDGAFSWDMWPQGNYDMTTDSDEAWKTALGGKHYMMGISPWFYTKLPAYQKTWVWRGDDLWHTRWDQIDQVKPDLVQIVTWNDYGESHYIGPIVDQGVPQSTGADARTYVDGMPHYSWRDLLPYYIARFKNNGTEPAIPTEKIQYWYRLTPAAAGRTDGVTGSNGPIFDPNTVVQDKVFITALTAAPANVSVQIGSNAPTYLNAPVAGANHFAVPFNGQTGVVTLKLICDGQVVVEGTGEAIQQSPGGDGATNYNAWVGGASA